MKNEIEKGFISLEVSPLRILLKSLVTPQVGHGTPNRLIDGQVMMPLEKK